MYTEFSNFLAPCIAVIVQLTNATSRGGERMAAKSFFSGLSIGFAVDRNDRSE